MVADSAAVACTDTWACRVAVQPLVVAFQAHCGRQLVVLSNANRGREMPAATVDGMAVKEK